MELVTDAPVIADSLVAHFDLRSGYLKEAERDKLVPAVRTLIDRELSVPGMLSGARG